VVILRKPRHSHRRSHHRGGCVSWRSSSSAPAASRCWPNRRAAQLFVKEEELVAKRGRTNRGDSQGNAFSYLVRRWHLRCNCEVPKEYQATLDNFDRTGYKGG